MSDGSKTVKAKTNIHFTLPAADEEEDIGISIPDFHYDYLALKVTPDLMSKIEKQIMDELAAGFGIQARIESGDNKNIVLDITFSGPSMPSIQVDLKELLVEVATDWEPTDRPMVAAVLRAALAEIETTDE